MEQDSGPRRHKRSALVTIAAILLLLPALLFSLGVIVNTVRLVQGPPPTPPALAGMREGLEEYVTQYRVGLLIYDAAWVVLLLPASLTLWRRWRHARTHATVAVPGVLSILAWGLFSRSEAISSGQLLVFVLWIVWAGLILGFIWRPAVAREFSKPAGEA